MKNMLKKILLSALIISFSISLNLPSISFATTVLNADIEINEVNFPDQNFLNYIKTSNFDINQDGNLSKEEIANVTYINVNMKGIKSLKGIEYFTSLKYLYAEMNYIETIDLSKNTNLVVVYCNNNMLTSVKLPNQDVNNTLEILNLFDNELTEVDLHNLKALKFLYISDNMLTNLDLSDNPLKEGQGFTADYNYLEKITLPNNNVDYPWTEFLATQSYPKDKSIGYKVNWYLDENKTQILDPNTTKTIKCVGQTLYAEYVPITYTVKFNPGQGVGEVKTQEFKYGTAQTLLKNDFTKSGYQFAGWKDSNGRIYADEAEVNNLTRTDGKVITLTATWKERDYTGEKYTINLYDGSGLIDSIEGTYGSTVELPENQISKEGYDFIGWNFGSGDYEVFSDGEKFTMTHPNDLNGQNNTLNLYSVWKKKEFTVNFIDSQNNYKSIVQYNDNVKFPATPSKPGYTFEGWITDSGEVWDEQKGVTSNLNLYPKYTPITYYVSFDGNGADNQDAMNNTKLEMDYSEQAILPTNMYEKSSHTLEGWSTSPNGSVEFADKDVIYQLTTENNKNVTLYAVWEKQMAESTVDITTDSLDKKYDGNVVSNPSVNKTGSTNEVILTWYQMVGSEWKEISSAPSNAGKYKVVSSVEADDNYKEASDELEFEITKATNSWTKEPSIKGWKAGEKANNPVGQAKFGKVEFTYSNSKDGQFTNTVPTEAGTWYMKATVIDNNNYAGLEKVVSFVILEDEIKVDNVEISNGNSETNKFTYGDKIVIKFTVNDKSRAVKKVALFANNVQVTDSQDAIVGKELTFVYDTKNGLVNATGEISLKLAYVDGNSIGKEIYNSVITLEKKSSDSGDIKIPEINENMNLDQLQIKDGNTVLKQGIDYDITKTQNGDEVAVIITFKGNYSGTITKTYKVQVVDNGTNTPDKGENVIRPGLDVRAGDRRYDTAVELSKSKFTTADTVVIAGGYALADGLTATPIATYYKSPLLLVEKNNIPEVTKNEIKRLGAKNVIIVGGTGVITQDVEQQLSSLGVSKITRLGGSDRYETALLVAQYIDSNLYDIENIVVTNGLGEADALSIAPVSGRDSMPIILVRSNSINSSIYNWLSGEGINNAYIIGGTTAVNDSVLNQVNGITKNDISGNRIGGSTRYETNAFIIDKFYGSSTNKVYVSKGLQLIDALSSGPIAALENSPVVLANNDLTATQRSILSKRSTNLVVQAGHGIPTNVVESLRDLLSSK